MSLFRKTKEEKQIISCACGGTCGEVVVKPASEKFCCGDSVDGICCIKVLGAGCASCHQMYENAKEAVNNIGLKIEVEYITDLQKVMEYGVMSMPALVINDKVISMGKVLKAAEIEKLLKI